MLINSLICKFTAVSSFRVCRFPLYLGRSFRSRGQKGFDRLGSQRPFALLQNVTTTEVNKTGKQVRLQSAIPAALFTTSSQMNFISDKEKYLKMPIESKRAEYQCGNKYVTLANIPTWKNHTCKPEGKSAIGGAKYPKNEALNDKISLFVGDITALEIDAIVNAANTSLRGGGGVDGAIHRAAGKSLVAECITLGGCPTGDAKITGGYKLPAKYVIHTVGPVGEKSDLLKSCYENSLKVAKDNGVKSIAFPCISTGVYHYPNENAAHIAIKTVREWLDSNSCSADRIIFCLFMPVDIEIYERLMSQYFPR